MAAVAGGASGIGLGVARVFVADGHRVAILDRHDATAAADELVPPEPQPGRDVDARDRSSVDAGFDLVRAAFGPIEIPATGAGIESFTTVLDITAESWEAMTSVNLLARQPKCSPPFPTCSPAKRPSSTWGWMGHQPRPAVSLPYHLWI
jgi:NAD(P)-dependent dehydrogenase (short-subunit alcohol dehydrogenase family)